jgi:POT family proton-dependent oligopeptide transporter
MALGFVTPVAGGYLSDRWLGHVPALRLGAVLATVGTFLLLGTSLLSFHGGLCLLVLGSGLIKAVVPADLGELAEPSPGQRDSMFSFLYICFNVGTLLGTVGCAVLGEIFGWRLAFLIAGGAMTCCSLLCLLGFEVAAQENAGRGRELRRAGDTVRGTRSTARMLGTLGTLLVIHTIFYALYEQSGLSLNLFAERNVDRSMAGLWADVSGEIPVTAFQAIDPILNIALGGLFVVGWSWLERHRVNLDYFKKFGIGLLFISLAYRVLTVRSGATLVSAWYLALAYLLFVVGEQCVIPTGFSAVTKLAPARHRSLFVGLWFCSFGAAVWLAGLLSRLTAAAGHPGTAARESLRIYQSTFSILSTLPALLGMGLLLVPAAASLGRRLRATPVVQS